MKDYKLSEIKAICEGQRNNRKSLLRCGDCELYGFCQFNMADDYPSNWQIDEEEQDDDGE